ncbi:O-antigen ligase family protein [Candidatus Microgenomates bacterium]|nr:O-antigen ligase family protein [Candidatus Microgenomates bacterium]
MLALWAKFNTGILKWFLAATLLVIPLYPKFPLFNVPGTYVAVRAEDFLLTIISALLFWYLAGNWQTFWRDKLNQAFFLFFIAGFISLLSGIFLTQTVVPHIGLLHWARRIEYVIPFFAAFIFVRKYKGVRFFGEILFIDILLIFLYAVGQKYFDWPVISTQNSEFAKGLALRLVPGARLHSTFGGHYDLAAFVALVFPICFAYFFTIKKWGYRFLLLIGTVIPGFWLLIQTESRISFAAYLVGVTLTLWLLKKKLLIVPVVVGSILVMLTFSNLGNRYLHTLKIYQDKILQKIQLNLLPTPVWAQEVEGATAPKRKESTILEKTPSPNVIEDRSTSIRLNVEWPRALRSFYKNPLLGTGYSSITLATDNDYLRLLGEVGLIGALAFFLIIARLFKLMLNFFHHTKKFNVQTAFVAGFAGSLVAMLINATFIDVFEASKVSIIFWLISGAAIGAIYKHDANQGFV